MIDASCHCGAVSLTCAAAPFGRDQVQLLDLPPLWGRLGLLPPSQVRLSPTSPATDIYLWDDRSIEFHRCRACGCVTHWMAVEKGADRMGVNARLMPPEEVAKARTRYLDGAVTEKYFDEN